MTDILRLLTIIVLLVIGLCAYFLVLHALFAPRIVRTKSVAQSMPARSFGIGFVNFTFFAVIALVLLAVAERTGPFLKGILTFPALLILAFLAIVLSFGQAGMSSLIGERLFPDLPAWKQLLWGAVCLSLGCALPFAGWFLLLPYSGLTGFGAVLLGLLQREHKG